MTHVLKTAFFSATLLMSAGSAEAQTAPSAFGHWEGVINSQLGSQDFVIDLGLGEDGKPIAALSIPAEGISGLPLNNVIIDGAAVSFELPGANAGAFAGVLAADGAMFSGMLEKPFGAADFAMTRTGEARFAAEPVNAAIDKRFEGEWTGALRVNGGEASVRIALSNPPGRGGIGRMILDGGAAFPLEVIQSGDTLTLNIPSAKESLTANLAGGDLVGEYVMSSGARAPLTLKRPSAN